jgi:hypothetical protein
MSTFPNYRLGHQYHVVRVALQVLLQHECQCRHTPDEDGSIVATNALTTMLKHIPPPFTVSDYGGNQQTDGYQQAASNAMIIYHSRLRALQ